MDSVVVTHIIRNNRSDINAAVSIGNFIWQSTSLPVTFEKINAKIVNAQLLVNWSTANEVNNDHFDVEVSKNGIDFIKVATVKTKNKNGNAVVSTDYSITVAEKDLRMSIYAGIIVLFVLLLLSRNRNKWLLAGLLGVVFMIPNFSCKKGLSNDGIDEKNTTVYVRIAQVDFDGTISYSKVVKAVNE